VIGSEREVSLNFYRIQRRERIKKMEGRKCSNQLALIEVSTTLYLLIYTLFPALPDLSTLFKAT
jgi:hypothetical protein